MQIKRLSRGQFLAKFANQCRFTNPGSKGRLSPAMGEPTLCAVYVETDDDTGLSTRISPVRLGGRLIEIMP